MSVCPPSPLQLGLRRCMYVQCVPPPQVSPRGLSVCPSGTGSILHKICIFPPLRYPSPQHTPVESRGPRNPSGVPTSHNSNGESGPGNPYGVLPPQYNWRVRGPRNTVVIQIKARVFLKQGILSAEYFLTQKAYRAVLF
jgi:hypothetical protein